MRLYKHISDYACQNYKFCLHRTLARIISRKVENNDCCELIIVKCQTDRIWEKLYITQRLRLQLNLWFIFNIVFSVKLQDIRNNWYDIQISFNENKQRKSRFRSELWRRSLRMVSIGDRNRAWLRGNAERFSVRKYDFSMNLHIRNWTRMPDDQSVGRGLLAFFEIVAYHLRY